MKCPIDGELLVIADRSGVEIDYCPKCRGVWLDRGELDKILERAAAELSQPVHYAHDRHDDDDFDDDRHRGGRHPKRRESLLSELFDFF